MQDTTQMKTTTAATEQSEPSDKRTHPQRRPDLPPNEKRDDYSALPEIKTTLKDRMQPLE